MSSWFNPVSWVRWIEDRSTDAVYPGHYQRGDAITYGAFYRIADGAMTLHTPGELRAWVMAAPNRGKPTRAERGFRY